MSDDDRFDWIGDDSIVLKRQDAIAIYRNGHGDVVIRRERDWNEDEDTCIVVQAANVLTVVAAILREAGLDNVRLERRDDPRPLAERLRAERPDLDHTAINAAFDGFDAREQASLSRAKSEKVGRSSDADAQLNLVAAE